MNIQELATCAQEGIAIKVFIMNNGYLGMVRQWQELFWDKRYSQVDMGQWPDFVKLAEAYGATGHAPEDKRTLVEDMQAGARHRRAGARRRARHARGEHLSDDPRRPAGAGHGRAERSMGEPERRKSLSLDELEAAGGLRTGRKHILSILVENKPGVLTRIAGLFARRGFNIDTLAVGPTDDDAVSRDHAHARRRRAPDRPGDQAAAQAGQRAEDPRPRAGGDARARARAVQGLGRRRQPRAR